MKPLFTLKLSLLRNVAASIAANFMQLQVNLIVHRPFHIRCSDRGRTCLNQFVLTTPNLTQENAKSAPQIICM